METVIRFQVASIVRLVNYFKKESENVPENFALLSKELENCLKLRVD